MPNLLINAGPGCGKTSTIVDAYLYYRSANPTMWLTRFQNTPEQAAIYQWCRDNFPRKPDVAVAGLDTYKAIYMAFNNTTVDDLKPRIHKDTDVKTHHGWGYSIIQKAYGFVPVNERAGEAIVEKLTGQAMSQNKRRFDWISSLRYVEKLQEELLDITQENLYGLQAKYSELAPFKIHPDMLSQCSEIIRAMKVVDRRIGITYMMQVWLALFLIKTPPHEIGFVDECQDLSPARLALSLKLAKNLVFVGDNNQAINGWNGADPHSMERIREYCAAEFPLRLSFRLPPNVAVIANQIRPTAQIKTLESKKDGEITKISPENLLDWTRKTLDRLSQHHDSKDKNPMIVCRYNAPLVKLALQYVKAGIPCKSLGGTLIKNLINTVQNRRATSMDDLMLKLEQYEARTLEVGNAMAKQANQDKFDCIRHVLRSCTTIDEFEPTLKRLLQPPKGTQHVVLSTVHKAKGLEAKVVGILNPPVASSKAETPDQIEQEKNVDFVAHTRTKSDMYYLHSEG